MVTTTTTTTFSMNREMAKGICQHFMDARLIENAADISSPTFKDKGVYMLTPKGLHILERFITKNGINGEHLLKVFSSQPICMKLLHLERRTHDDELLINRPVVEVIFRRFVGRQPNYPTRSTNPGDGRNGNDGDFDRTMGIEMADVSEKVKGQGTKVIKHTFSAVSVLDWLCDFTTICGRDEAAEIAAHFVRLNLISLLSERGKRDENPASVIVRGDDGHGRQTEGEFRCHYKAVYGVTDLGRAVARWEGYRYPETVVMSSRASPVTMSRRSTEDSASAAPPSDDGASQHSERQRVGSVVGATGSDKGSMGQSASQESKLNRRASAAERLRNDYLDTGLYNSRDSNTNRLKQILEEPALRSLFREFLKQNFCEENLSFWLDVQDFKRRFHTTSSAVAVRQPNQASGGGVGGAVRKLGRGQQNVGARSNQFGLTAMEKHQQDLIAMAFVIYNTYLAPASLCELNIEHNLRSELVGYMTKVLSDAKGGPGGLGSAEALASLTSVKSRDSNDTSEERREASGIARAPLHASQLQTMVRLYERIQDHIFRLMATDSVPRFIKDPRFLNLVRSVEVSRYSRDVMLACRATFTHPVLPFLTLRNTPRRSKQAVSTRARTRVRRSEGRSSKRWTWVRNECSHCALESRENRAWRNDEQHKCRYSLRSARAVFFASHVVRLAAHQHLPRLFVTVLFRPWLFSRISLSQLAPRPLQQILRLSPMPFPPL